MTTQTTPTTQQQETVYLSYSEIGGRSWSPIGDRTYIRSIAPGQKAPSEAMAVTPDVRKPRGWRIAWIFLCLVPLCFVCSAAERLLTLALRA
jgi:hypothetical protein